MKKYEFKKINRALISVSDKSELTKILKVLKKFKVEILSSGGTYKKINRLGYKSIEISDFTNSPEILDGRVKTLHQNFMEESYLKGTIKSIKNKLKKLTSKDRFSYCKFLPFWRAVKTGNDKKIIENIDIGGPTLVRAAAKNYEDVTVITDTSQYIALQNEMNKYRGSTSLNFRKILSRDAFLKLDITIQKLLNIWIKLTMTLHHQKEINWWKFSWKFKVWGKSSPRRKCLFFKQRNKYKTTKWKKIKLQQL